MNEDPELALKQAQLLERSAQAFPVFEFFLIVVAASLALFILRKRAQSGLGVPPPAYFLAVAASALGISAVFAKLWGFGHALGALGYGTGMTLSFVDPVAGVGFLLANSFMRPWEMSGVAEMGFLPKTLFAITLLSWLFHAARTGRFGILFNGPCRCFYILAAWFLVCALNSGDFMEGLQKYSGNVLIASIIFLLVTNVAREQADLEILRRVLIYSITGLIIHALIVTFIQPDYDPSVHRLEDAGTVGNSNDLAAMIVIALPLALVPAFRKRKGAVRIAVLTVPCLLAGLWVSQSRGAILALVTAAIGYGVLRARNKKRALTLAALCVPCLVAMSTLLTFARDSDDLQGSTNSRMSFVIAGLNMGLRNPIMGVGHDNFGKLWDSYAIGQTFESGSRSGHGTWLIAFAENGLPGLLLFVTLFVTVFKRAVQIRELHPELLTSLLGYAVAMTFLTHVYTIYPYLLFALILAGKQIEIRELGRPLAAA